MKRNNLYFIQTYSTKVHTTHDDILYGPQTVKKFSILSLKLVILSLFSSYLKNTGRIVKNIRVGVLL